jgi:5-enolpyruvylshikimate-3-phosphate synthase
MAATIGALISDRAIVINNVDCIQKSYPDFFSDIEKVKS